MSEDLIRAVVVRDTCLQDHPGRLSDLVRALRASRAPFASEAALARAARRYDQTPAQFAQAYAGLRPLGEEENAAFFADGARKLRGVLTHIHDEMLKARLIVAPVDLAQLPMQAVP